MEPPQRIALVTGANRGIGREIARVLATRGMRVYAGARDAARGTRAAEELAGAGDVRAIALDVADDASVAAAADEIAAGAGRLDVLVNNAAINLDLGPDGPVAPAKVTPKAVRETFAVNVAGVVAVINAMLPLLRRSDAPRIVNLSTEIASLTHMTDPEHRAAKRLLLAYNSSKTAVNALTLIYANALRADGILVNAAGPGYVATDMNDHQGVLTVQEGARVPVALATLGADGPTGTFVGDDGSPTGAPLPW
jgi:NAD(P)-dependent dehydrogenase (short-subunit alcohol dehydrogenase family)